MFSVYRSFSCWLLLACTLLLSCADDHPRLPPLNGGDVVLAFGDSLTYGTGARDGESYPEVLSALIGHEVVAAGVPGERTADGMERLAGVLDVVQPRIMLLCLGGNDMLRKVDAGEIENNLRQMIGTAKSRGVSVVLIGVPRPALFGGTADFYERIAMDFKIPYEGAILNEILRENTYKADPIHPNAQGYRLFAQAVADLLRTSGAI